MITDTRVLGSVSRLLEFYDKEDLHAFFHRCEREGYDTIKAFVFLDNKTMELLSKTSEVPKLEMIIKIFEAVTKAQEILSDND